MLDASKQDGCPISGPFTRPAVHGRNLLMRLLPRVAVPQSPFTGGLLYRMSGFDGKSEQGGSLDIYDPTQNTWSSREYPPDGVSGPTPRSVCALVPIVVRGKALLVTLFGERDPSSLGHQGAGKMLGDVWAYDIDSATWSKIKANGASVFDEPAPRGTLLLIQKALLTLSKSSYSLILIRATTPQSLLYELKSTTFTSTLSPLILHTFYSH
jgi:hypothetical protein